MHGHGAKAEINLYCIAFLITAVAGESSLDFDAYWKAWLATRLVELREKAEKAHQMEEEQGEEEEF